MISGFNQIQFNKRVFNDSPIYYIYHTENILRGADRKVPLLCGKFISLIKAFVRQPLLKFRTRESD